MLMPDSSTGNLEFFNISHNQITGAGSIGHIDTSSQTLGVGAIMHS